MAEERAEQQQNQNQRMQGQRAPGQAEELVKEKKQDADAGIIYRYCKYCEEPLSANEKFCHSCGEEYGGKENICPYDQTATTKKFCPVCKNLIVPYTCPQCKAETLNPVCSCGKVLDTKLQAALNTAAQAQKIIEQQVAPSFRQMTAEEVKNIEAFFKKEEENAEYKKFRKRILEREKLLAERGYYNKMEKRIVEVFGASPFKFEMPDPEEQAARMRLYSSLEQSILKKQRLATQAELEALYPELHYIHEMENKAAEEKAAAEEESRARRAEIAKRQKEMEEKYSRILGEIDQEVKEVREEERRAEEQRREQERKRLLAEKAAEEARLKKEREEADRREKEESKKRAEAFAAQRAAAEKAFAEETARWAAEDKAAAERRAKMISEAREKAERQAHLNRYLGIYVFEEGQEKLTIAIDRPDHGFCNDRFQRFLSKQVYAEHRVTMSGNSVTLTETANPENFPMAYYFKGDLNSSGTVLSGYWHWRDGTITRKYTYYKTR